MVRAMWYYEKGMENSLGFFFFFKKKKRERERERERERTTLNKVINVKTQNHPFPGGGGAAILLGLRSHINTTTTNAAPLNAVSATACCQYPSE